MSGGLCDQNEATPKPAGIARRVPPVAVAVLLRESGSFPLARDSNGRVVDPSPLAGLSPLQKRRRLSGILEMLACHGDPFAASEALRHARWEEEMRKGKAPSRDSLAVSGNITVIDDLRTPGQTPIPMRSRPRSA